MTKNKIVKKTILFFRGKDKFIAPIIFLIGIGYCVFLWWSYIYNSNWNENQKQEYKNNIQIAELTAKLAELNAKKTLLEKHKMDLSARNSEASILLSDKNRLLATVNSNIQQKYTRLEDVNNQINTITQDIYTNNLETKRKENIIQTLKVIIIIVIIMAVILIIYFGMEYVETNHPNAITNLTNKLNGSIFI